MADEIIEVLEYITGNSMVQVAFIAILVLCAIGLAGTFSVFIIAFKRILKNFNRMDRWR